MKSLLWIVCLASVCCASVSPSSRAAPPLDLQTIDDRWSLHVVTVDPDGGERVTRIWIAIVDGEPAIRTNDSRWWGNLHRDPSIRVRLSGSEYAFRAELVTKPTDRVRIDEAFLDKYGGWERVLFPQERGETHENYATLQPR